MSRIERLRALLQSIPWSYRHEKLTEFSKGLEDELQDADKLLWSHIEASLDESDAIRRHGALILWQKWLNEPEEPQIFREIFTQAGYWLKLELGLRSNDRFQEKFALHLLLRSLELLDQDIDVVNFRFQLRDKPEYVAQYRKFCSLFQIIVFDRYRNQVEDCLASFPHVPFTVSSENGNTAEKSLVLSTWWTTLFAAALRPSMLDCVRQCIGSWLLSLPFPIQAASEDYKTLLVESLLPWAAQGCLLVGTIRRNGKEVQCLHGDRLASFCSELIRACPRGETKSFYIRAILNWINNSRKELGSHAMSYILKGIAEAVETSDWQADEDIPDSLMAICRRSTLSSVQQLFIIDHCRRICSRGLTFGPRESLLRSYPEATDDLNHVHPYQDLISIEAEIAGSNFACLRGDGLVEICQAVKDVIQASEFRAESPGRIFNILSAVWNETDIQEHPRNVVGMMPQIVLNPNVLQLAATHNELRHFLSSVLSELYSIAERRIYVWNPLAESLRAGYLRVPNFLDIFQLESIFEQFVSNPPVPIAELILDVAISRTDTSGHQLFRMRADEGRGHACMFDILNRLQAEHRPFARRLFDRLLEPWLEQLNQNKPVPLVSKWKKTSQLQAVILLLNTAVDFDDRHDITNNFHKLLSILALEPMPRFRFLLEWAILSLLHLRSPELRHYGYAEYILDHLDKDDQTNPKFTASMVRMATLISTHSTATEEYANRLLIRLAVLSTSPRISIRHEAQWHFPIVWKHYLAHLWSGNVLNPILVELFRSIQSYEKYIEPPRDRILSAFDLEKDRTLAILFQGGYLAVDPPEEPLCTIDDFKDIWADENGWAAGVRRELPSNFPAGVVNPRLVDLINKQKFKPKNGISNLTTKAKPSQQPNTALAPLQTKFQSLCLPHLTSAPVTQPNGSQGHNSNSNSPQLILIASLISATHNLGGLCRAAECFGAAELHIHTLSVLEDKSFLSVSVSSEQHITIRETPVSSLAEFLRGKQDQGFSVVAVEQTDTSVVIPGWDRSKEEEREILPQRCVVVMGAERTGVPATVLGVVDRCVEIGQWGVTRSLNVQTAAAVVCYEWRRIWGGHGEREGG